MGPALQSATSIPYRHWRDNAKPEEAILGLSKEAIMVSLSNHDCLRTLRKS
jgi:hypothetical protein